MVKTSFYYITVGAYIKEIKIIMGL